MKRRGAVIRRLMERRCLLEERRRRTHAARLSRRPSGADESAPIAFDQVNVIEAAPAPARGPWQRVRNWARTVGRWATARRTQERA